MLEECCVAQLLPYGGYWSGNLASADRKGLAFNSLGNLIERQRGTELPMYRVKLVYLQIRGSRSDSGHFVKPLRNVNVASRISIISEMGSTDREKGTRSYV
jgi:hypothetical protein